MDDYLEMNFPIAGVDREDAFGVQKPREVAKGVYARTTPAAVNVVAYEPLSGRKRGGSRPGLAQVIPDQPVAGWIVQGLGVIGTTVFNYRLANGSFADPSLAGTVFDIGTWDTISFNWDDVIAAWDNA